MDRLGQSAPTQKHKHINIYVYDNVNRHLDGPCRRFESAICTKYATVRETEGVTPILRYGVASSTVVAEELAEPNVSGPGAKVLTLLQGRSDTLGVTGFSAYRRIGFNSG